VLRVDDTRVYNDSFNPIGNLIIYALQCYSNEIICLVHNKWRISINPSKSSYTIFPVCRYLSNKQLIRMSNYEQITRGLPTIEYFECQRVNTNKRVVTVWRVRQNNNECILSANYPLNYIK